MRLSHILALAALVVPASTAAQIGRLPLLAELPMASGTCRSPGAVSGALRRAGIVRVVSFSGGTPARLISVSLDVRRRPVHLLVLASVPAGATRREGESVTVFFAPSGAARAGSRSYTTMGTPATRAEDRCGGLLPGDSAAALALARAVTQRCAS